MVSLRRPSGQAIAVVLALAEELATEPPVRPEAAWAIGALGRWPRLEGT
jgi:hypothetical protein